MKRSVLALVFSATLLVYPFTFASGQQPAAQSTRTGAALDLASVRRQAAQLGEVRAALADPDPNMRLASIREIVRNGDPIQRQLAIEVGLASAETSLQEVAIRGLMVDITLMVFAVTDMDGKVPTQGNTNYTLSMGKFDPDTGKAEGPGWSGQFQGGVFNFNQNGIVGRLAWDSAVGEFRGIVNFNNGKVGADHRASWRPR